MKIGYGRVSTTEQDIIPQEQKLSEAGCEKIFSEYIGGAWRQKKVLHEAIDYARAGDTLVVCRLDRLSRSLKELLETAEELNKRGINLCSLAENIDSSTASGSLVFNMFGAIAEFERRLISERTKAGIEAAKRRGKKPGRPPSVNESKKRDIAILLKNEEFSARDVANLMEISLSTLYRHFPAAKSKAQAKPKLIPNICSLA